MSTHPLIPGRWRDILYAGRGGLDGWSLMISGGEVGQFLGCRSGPVARAVIKGVPQESSSRQPRYTCNSLLNRHRPAVPAVVTAVIAVNTLLAWLEQYS